MSRLCSRFSIVALVVMTLALAGCHCHQRHARAATPCGSPCQMQAGQCDCAKHCQMNCPNCPCKGANPAAPEAK